MTPVRLGENTWANHSLAHSLMLLFLFVIGGVIAGCEKGDPFLSEGQGANHWSGGEHERLCLSFMQG